MGVGAGRCEGMWRHDATRSITADACCQRGNDDAQRRLQETRKGLETSTQDCEVIRSETQVLRTRIAELDARIADHVSHKYFLFNGMRLKQYSIGEHHPEVAG